MALDPQAKDSLMRFSMIAKKIIYDATRMQRFMKMLGTKQGSLVAVQTVLGAIEKQRPIPPNIAPLLGVNVYMLMVDVAQESTGHQPDAGIIKEVMGMILQTVQKSYSQPKPQQQAQQPMQQPQPPRGIINSRQGVPA